MSSVAQRFEAAVGTLVGDGPIKQRLTDAYQIHLQAVEPDELPQALMDSFRQLQAALERLHPYGKESAVEASVRKMSPREAGDHAAAILALFCELIRTGHRQEPLKVVDNSADLPPRYLAARNG